MVGAFDALVSAWIGLFAEIPYPPRIVVATLLAMVAVRLMLRWVLPLLGRLVGGASGSLSRWACGLLLCADLLWSGWLVRRRRRFPALLRRYGTAVEDLSDVLARCSALIPRVMGASAKTGRLTAVAIVAASVLLINVPGVSAGRPDTDVAPFTRWWNHTERWIDKLAATEGDRGQKA